MTKNISNKNMDIYQILTNNNILYTIGAVSENEAVNVTQQKPNNISSIKRLPCTYTHPYHDEPIILSMYNLNKDNTVTYIPQYID